MQNQTREIIEEILQQTARGIVEIGDKTKGCWKFYTRLHSSIGDKKNYNNLNYPVLYIPNYDSFISKIDTYLEYATKFYESDKAYFELNDNDFKKKLFLDLLINASYFDFLSIYNYIDDRTEMLKTNQPLGNLNLGNFQQLKITAKVSKNRSNLESPYRFDIIFEDEFHNKFKLPSIMFGIAQNKCYVMAIQNLNKDGENILSKKLDRFFRKVNKGVDMDSIIANISPNALVSFSIFCEYLKQNKIEKITAPSFMPVRYNANKISGLKKSKNARERQEFLEKHNHNQHNITEKFMYMFLRYEFHFDNAKTNYDNIKLQMDLNFKRQKATPTENIIHSISRSIQCNEKQIETISKS